MAEFCLSCYRESFIDYGTPDENIIMSDEYNLDLCEGCGQWKQVVLEIKND